MKSVFASQLAFTSYKQSKLPKVTREANYEEETLIVETFTLRWFTSLAAAHTQHKQFAESCKKQFVTKLNLSFFPSAFSVHTHRLHSSIWRGGKGSSEAQFTARRRRRLWNVSNGRSVGDQENWQHQNQSYSQWWVWRMCAWFNSFIIISDSRSTQARTNLSRQRYAIVTKRIPH